MPIKPLMPYNQIPLDETSNTMLLPHPYQHVEELKHATLETLKAFFNEGRCHIYALMLQNNHPQLKLQAIYRDDQLQHIYCVNPVTGIILDSTGTYATLEEYMNADAIHRFLMVEHEPVTVEEIISLVDNGTLIHSSLATIGLAEQTAFFLDQK